MMQRVKQVTAEDTALLEQITELERLCIPNPWSFEMFQLEAGRTGGIVLAALDENGDVSGFLTAQRVADTADINNVAVHPDKRRHSIGSALLAAFLELTQDCTQIFLEVRASNEAAIGLYKKHGFLAVGMRKRYYTNPVEDGILMQYGGTTC
ncbi:MAG: ribosomal protein S18-alanine N-acetyltransferase [Oscillospiraceae bacterium]|jgi:ribosomal-protein-alanine N-acetyltransferase|nr:ribosomal protein S18-alanine N-acetyltransferase [Oscillospiraceae bacterium]MBQ9111740.1 ribosomal protein S18-alanine N-acetyltransferase [Oscillospiraceae bacterium]